MVRPKIRFRKSALVAIAATAVMALGACAGGTTSSSTTSATADANATGEALPTVTKGKLTIATGDPAYTPWVLNDNPESGEGYEAAVAYAVAEKLGFSKDQVVWKRTTFDSAIAPGAKDWDFNIQQFSITDARREGHPRCRGQEPRRPEEAEVRRSDRHDFSELRDEQAQAQHRSADLQRFR